MAEGGGNGHQAKKSKWKRFCFPRRNRTRSSSEPIRFPDPVNCVVCAQLENLTATRLRISEAPQAHPLPPTPRVPPPPAGRSSRAPPLPPIPAPPAPPRYVEPDPPVRCQCTKCCRRRGEDPLTVELLPMDTQITLQNALQDSFLMCNLL